MRDLASDTVSILIPAYRAAAFLAETLASIRAQTWTNWELFVLEDGVFDETGEIVGAFRQATVQPVHHIQLEKNLGVSHARNRMLDEARGAYIAFIDADDTWHPEHLEHCIDLLKHQPRASWVISGLNLIDPAGKLIKADVLPPDIAPEKIPDALLTYNFILTSGMVLRSSALLGPLRFDTNLKIGEDLDLCIRLIQSGQNPIASKKTTLNYRKHPVSTTADPIRFCEEFSRVSEKYLHNSIITSALARRCHRSLLINAARMSWRRSPGRARIALRRLLRHDPICLSAWLYALLSWPRFR